MKSNQLTCKELVELVTEYLEGALPPPDRTRFEEHLAQCRHCRVYLEQMKQTIHAVGALTEDTVPPEAKETLLQVFRDWRRGSGTR